MKIHFNGGLFSGTSTFLRTKVRQHKLVMCLGNSVSDFAREDGGRCVNFLKSKCKGEKNTQEYCLLDTENQLIVRC